ncbi:MAG: hypothetical protein M3Y08_07120 [Fibrobacterota bacterium]|nr:hypothetical protein [Fibrobacterota bacterium]
MGGDPIFIGNPTEAPFAATGIHRKRRERYPSESWRALAAMASVICPVVLETKLPR